MLQSNFELSVIVNDKKIHEHYHDGKVFIEGKKGSEFSLKFRNNSFENVLIVPSIDGLSTINGKKASIDSGGYIVKARKSITIEGWRTSLDEVAKFIFDDKESSYASKKLDIKDDSNCGVIGLRVFSEKKMERLQENHYYWHYYQPYYPLKPYYPYSPYTDPYFTPWYTTPNICQTSNNIQSDYLNSSSINATTKDLNLSSTVSYDSSTPNFNLGTKFGKRSENKVEVASFETDKLLTEFVVYYSDRIGLEEAGIIIKDEKVKIFPSPFLEFCEPPIE